jgi:hypothetical protein
VPRQIGHKLGDGIADGIRGQGGGDAGCAGAKTMLPARNIHIAKRVGGNGTNDGGVVEHRDALIALGDDYGVQDVQDSLANGEIRHAVVVRILVGKRGNEKGAEELTRHVLGKRHTGIFGKSFKPGSVSGVGIARDADRGHRADGQEIERVAYIFRRQDELLPRSERHGRGGVEEAGEDRNVGLAAHPLLRQAGGIRQASGANADNVGTAGWRHGHSAGSRWADGGKSGLVVAPLPSALLLADVAL